MGGGSWQSLSAKDFDLSTLHRSCIVESYHGTLLLGRSGAQQTWRMRMELRSKRREVSAVMAEHVSSPSASQPTSWVMLGDGSLIGVYSGDKAVEVVHLVKGKLNRDLRP